MTARSRLTSPLARTVLVLLLGASAAVAVVLFHARSTSAFVPPAVVPLSKADLPLSIRAAIRAGASADGVDPDSVVEVGGIGAGDTSRAALVGKDRSGLARISFLQGFGMTFFQPPGRLFQQGEPMAFSEGFSGPQHEPVRIGVVGAARANVDRVTIEVADGSVIDAPLARNNGLSFFAYAGESPAAFPTVVRAYGHDGMLLQTHEIPRP